MGAMKVWDGSTWQTVAPFSERASCYVGPEAPVGTAYAGDLWWDTDDPTIAYPGAELAYNQITTSVTINSTNSAAPNLAIEGTSRAYDGSPVIIEVSALLASPSVVNAAILLNLWDGSTDLGIIAQVWNQSTATGLGMTVHGRRRLTPTVATHNYRVLGWCTTGAGNLYATPGGAGNNHLPAFIRVTRV